jgi:hypothetical protein
MDDSPTKPLLERYFYSAATVVLLGLTVVGFQLFYFHGQVYPGEPMPPPIKALIITHGLAMSLWMLFSVVQPFLIASGNRRLHMAMGKIAASIAVCLVLLGMKLGIASCQASPPGSMDGPLTPKQFLSVPVGNILLFALFAAAGVWWRKLPDIHKPMMFLASLTLVAAAIARIDFLNNLYAGTVWEKLFGFFFFAVVISGLFLVIKCVVFRKFDRWFAAGYGVMVAWFLMVAQIARTPTWDAIASVLVR